MVSTVRLKLLLETLQMRSNQFLSQCHKQEEEAGDDIYSRSTSILECLFRVGGKKVEGEKSCQARLFWYILLNGLNYNNQIMLVTNMEQHVFGCSIDQGSLRMLLP